MQLDFFETDVRGARLRRRGRLNEAGGDIRVHVSVCLLGEGLVQSVRARLEWLCPRRNLNHEGARACTVFSLDSEKVSAYFVIVAQRASIASGAQPAPRSPKSILKIWGVPCVRGKERFMTLSASLRIVVMCSSLLSCI